MNQDDNGITKLGCVNHDCDKCKAQQQQEPVAWVCYGWSSDEKHAIDYEQHEIDAIPVGTLLYTSPPASKTWVGLTDEEAEGIWNHYCDEMGEASINDAPDIARAIESALRSKNT